MPYSPHTQETPALCNPAGPVTGAADPFTVLHVSPSRRDSRSLYGIFRSAGWNLHSVPTILDALLYLYRATPAVVIAECDLPDGKWHIFVEYFADAPSPPRLVVSSRLADDRLWAEVVNLGGFDVLRTPFDTLEVRHVVTNALDSWHRHASNALKKSRSAGKMVG